MAFSDSRKRGSELGISLCRSCGNRWMGRQGSAALPVEDWPSTRRLRYGSALEKGVGSAQAMRARAAARIFWARRPIDVSPSRVSGRPSCSTQGGPPYPFSPGRKWRSPRRPPWASSCRAVSVTAQCVGHAAAPRCVRPVGPPSFGGLPADGGVFFFWSWRPTWPLLGSLAARGNEAG